MIIWWKLLWWITSSVLVWVLVIFGWSVIAQSKLLLNEKPEYWLHTIYAWSLTSWSTNQEIQWRDGYCSLIARKNQEQIAKLVWSDYRTLRWHAIDLINQWREDALRFRAWNRTQFSTYIDTMDDSMIDVYSYVLEDDMTVSNPEDLSYRSPHRFTVIKYSGNVWVLDPLRGKKTTKAQPLQTYLPATNADHRFLVFKRSVALGATRRDTKPAVVYEQSLLNSLIRHYIHWYIEPLQWSDIDTIQWIVFNKPFQYVNTEWDVLTISKDTIVRLEDMYGPMSPRVFEWSPQTTIQLFHAWDRSTSEWNIAYYNEWF